LAARRVPETFQDLHSCGLSSAVGSEEGKDFTLGKVERNLIDGYVVAVFLGEFVYLYDFIGCRSLEQDAYRAILKRFVMIIVAVISSGFGRV